MSAVSSGKKGRGAKSNRNSSRSATAPPTPVPSDSGSGMPSVEEVCSSFGLTDVNIEFSDADLENLTTYKLFQQHVRPMLVKENPKVPMSKLMMLVAAKWRMFSESNPHLGGSVAGGGSEENTNNSVTSDYTPKPSRSRSARDKSKDDDLDDIDEEEDDEGSDSVKRRGRRPKNANNKGKLGRKPKVPTLKIKFGKRKRASSVSLRVMKLFHPFIV